MKKVMITFILPFLFWGLSSAQLPFENDSVFNNIRLELTVDGKLTNALFDNGTELSVMFLRDKNELNKYKVERETFITDSKGNRSPAYLLKNVKIEIDLLGLKEKQKVLAFIGVPKILDDLNVSFILGNAFIDKYDWKIDFNIQTLSIEKKIAKQNFVNFFHLELIEHYGSGDFIEVSSESLTDTFKIDLGNSNTLITSNEKFFKNPEYVKIGYNESINNTSTDTLYLYTTNKLLFSDSLCVSDLPVFVQTKSHSNLIGLGFLKPFGEVILVNSQNLLLLKQIDKHVFVYPAQVVYDNKVVSFIKPIEKSNSSNDHLTEDEIPKIKKIQLPPTLYKRKAD